MSHGKAGHWPREADSLWREREHVENGGSVISFGEGRAFCEVMSVTFSHSIGCQSIYILFLIVLAVNQYILFLIVLTVNQYIVFPVVLTVNQYILFPIELAVNQYILFSVVLAVNQ